MSEPRPYRPAREADRITAKMRGDVTAGRLDGDAVNAVFRAAGQRAPARRSGIAGLTAREIEVLVLIARGHPNKEIARRLSITPKTVSNHVEHVYAKLGIASRAAATLYATQHPQNEQSARGHRRGTTTVIKRPESAGLAPGCMTRLRGNPCRTTAR
jgi:DNA-binding CsgD family transcriptional regulator